MFTQADLSSLIQTAVDDLSYPAVAAELFAPVKYTLEAGGKRLRPTLVLMAANLYTDHLQPVIAPAVGLEMYHNYTLLHDDVMDKAPDRRGRATVHVKWDDNTAILSGDVMQALAYRLIAQAPEEHLAEIVRLFTDTNIEICEGQQLDMEFESRTSVEAGEYLEMIRLKTAVLLGCAMKMGAVIGGATADDADALYRFGQDLGLAFQLQDDWLDCYGDPATFGKRIGGDISNNKKTYLLIQALHLMTPEQRAVAERELNPTTATLTEAAKIDYFCTLYKECGAEAACRDKILQYHCSAVCALQKLHLPADKTQHLLALANKLLNRNV